MSLIIMWFIYNITAVTGNAEETPMVFQLFQPISEKKLIFQLLQHLQPDWTSCPFVLSEMLLSKTDFCLIQGRCIPLPPSSMLMAARRSKVS